MSDYFKRVDIETVTTFTDAASLADFGFQATKQSVYNDNPDIDAIVEVSFNGIDVHARLQGTGSTKAMGWSEHNRPKLYVRRPAGGPAGSRYVDIYAETH